MRYHGPTAKLALGCFLVLVATLGNTPRLAAQRVEALPHALSVLEPTVASGPSSPEEMEPFLDADVNQYLTSFQIPDTYPQPVTPAHFLTHTGGFEHRGDIVISAADGHTTILDMLEGKYLDDKIRRYYDELPFPAYDPCSPRRGLPMAAVSGRYVTQIICKEDKRQFVTTVQ